MTADFRTSQIRAMKQAMQAYPRTAADQSAQAAFDASALPLLERVKAIVSDKNPSYDQLEQIRNMLEPPYAE